MDSDEENDALRGLELEHELPDIVQPKKKKKKKRPTRKRGTGTGFEEYYADAPTTPEEALKEQQELYSSIVPFEQRIQTCIHRYRSRRRFDNEVSLYFNEYASLGGIDTTTALFNEQGLEDTSLLPQSTNVTNDNNNNNNNTPENDDAATSSRYYDGNARNWTVDFTSIVSGFLSFSIIPLTGLEPEPTEKAITVVENFLRYVLQHDVCPEYEADIRGALAVCARARDEWPRVQRFKSMLPGNFQLAAAQTFGVHDESDWSLLQQRCKPSATCSPEVVFYTSLVVAGQAVPKDADGKSAVRIVKRFTTSLELQSIEMPDEAVVDCFRRLALGSDEKTMLGLQPLGRAVFRPTVIEDGWVHQKSPETLHDDDDDDDGGGQADVIFFFEKEILEEMTLGLKVTAVVAELSTGFRFVKKFEVVQPSFYLFLPQHLMKGFKPPCVNDRPARSIHDRGMAVGGGQEQGQDEDEDEE